VHLALQGDSEVPDGVVTQSYLVGTNWLIADLDRRQLERLRGALGGLIRHAA
jgi:hypothetical protein